jgi:simple sugar transport system ATP-binding protein
VEGLRVADATGIERVKGVSFNIRRGEIVGVAGVAGNGQSELLEALAGIRPLVAGRIRWKGRDITDDPAIRTAKGMRHLGLGHVPEDRQRMGLVAPFAAAEGSILGYHDDRPYNRGLLLDHAVVSRECRRQMQEYDVRPADDTLPCFAFSGGNQQKIVVAREVAHDPDVLLVGQPTRGVDIGAIEFIHRRLVALRDAGKGILLVSVELDEILSLSDRILVMFDGRIVGELTPEQATERTVGLMMAGVAAEAA